jgi:hypothetical protein
MTSKDATSFSLVRWAKACADLSLLEVLTLISVHAVPLLFGNRLMEVETYENPGAREAGC